jgi:NTE family protein
VKLKSEDVHYLCFEGGGGKGPIYLGALKALGDLGILRYKKKKLSNSEQVYRLDPFSISGVAGTSIGSLTALLIASGHTPDEMGEILKGSYGIETLDKVDYGKIPTVYTLENPRYIIEKETIPEEKELFDDFWKKHILDEKFSIKHVLQVPAKALNQFGKKLLTYVLKWYFSQKFRKPKENTEETNEEITSNTMEIASNKLLETTESLNSFKYDLGFFLSEFSREFVDALIEKKCGIKNCTFRQFYDEFQIDLVVTGFDITKKQTLFFRKDQWPDLCVADALRMSVSIPFIFKPVYLNYDEGKIIPVHDDLRGASLIVDGGLGANLPLHVFDQCHSSTSPLNPNMLGFRFKKELSLNEDEMTIASYAGTIFSALLGQTTELQIRSPEEQDQVINLDHEEVDVLDFFFTEKTQEYVDKAYAETMKYFK